MIEVITPAQRLLQKLDLWAERLASDRLFLLKLFVTAFLLRAALILLHSQVNLSADMLGYHESAMSLLRSGELRIKGRLSASRPPVYPIFIYLVYYIFGPGNILMLRLIQAVLGGVISVLTVLLGRKVFSAKVGVWGGLFYTLYPAAWTFSDMVMSEILFTVLLMSSLFFLVDFPRRRMSDAVLAGILLGSAAMTRTVLYQFPLFFAAIILITSKQRWKHVPHLVVFLLSFWIVLLPWMARNNRVFSKPVITTKSGVDLYFYNHNPFMYIIYNYREEESLNHLSQKTWAMSETGRDSLARNIAVAWIEQHPLLFAFKGVRMQWNYFGIEREYLWWLLAGYWGKVPKWQIALMFPLIAPWAYLLIPLFIWGLVYSWKKIRAKSALLWVLVYNLAVTFVYYGYSRSRMPLNPILMLFAGYALTQYQPILDDWKSPGVFKRPLVLAALGLLAFIILGWALELFVDLGSFLHIGFTGFDWGEISK
jgi:4-amino-4-deoxy-L-arabinose transferase-like glycosyltransferase